MLRDASYAFAAEKINYDIRQYDANYMCHFLKELCKVPNLLSTRAYRPYMYTCNLLNEHFIR